MKWGVRPAFDNFDEVIRLGLKDANSYYNRVAAALSMRRAKTALQDFTKAIRLDPQSGYAYYGRGAAYLLEAQSAWAGGTDLALSLSTPHTGYQKATEDYRKAMAIDSEGAGRYAREAIEHLSDTDWIRFGRIRLL